MIACKLPGKVERVQTDQWRERLHRDINKLVAHAEAQCVQGHERRERSHIPQLCAVVHVQHV